MFNLETRMKHSITMCVQIIQHGKKKGKISLNGRVVPSENALFRYNYVISSLDFVNYCTCANQSP